MERLNCVHECPSTDQADEQTTQTVLHRLAAVRRQQGVSRRTVARRLGMEVSQVKAQERESSDLLLSRLYQWQQLLEVPITELLVEAGDPLSEPVLKRAQLVRVMKTVLAILETSEQESIQRMAQTLVEQLTEIMPELEGVGPWHAVGERRRRDEYGVAAERRLADSVFTDMGD
ncbi:MAG TPA: helix-turn-helix transcriptional regulator [Thermoguttaceae bacterium]|nr:helix-turn-helix transcriptional regulator [Thermoguttaceae bacterium]